MDLTSLISGGSSLLNTLLAYGFQSSLVNSTNEMNYYMHLDDIATMKDMYNQEKAENRYLIESERNYNDPSAERARLLSAGINPVLAKYNGVGSQSSVGVGSPPKHNFSPSPQMEMGNYDFVARGVSDAVNVMSQSMASAKLESDIAAQNQRVKNETLETASRIASSDVDSDYKRTLISQMLRDMQFSDDSYAVRLRNLDLQNDDLIQNIEMKKAQTTAIRIANEFAPELQMMQKVQFANSCAESAARVADLYASANLSEEQKKKVTEDIVNQQIINKNLPKELHNNRAIQVATYDEVRKRAELINQQRETERWRTVDAYRGSGGKYGSSSRSVDDLERGVNNNYDVPYRHASRYFPSTTDVKRLPLK